MRWYYYTSILIVLILISVVYINREKTTEIGVSQIDRYRIGHNIITDNIEISDYIELSKNEWKTVLVKDKNKWFVSEPSGRNLPAEEGRIKSLFEQLNDIKVDRISSVNPANFETFLVDEPSAFNVIIKSGETNILHFLIGKNNDSFTGTYVRRSNDNTTLLTDKRITSNVVNAKRDFWINLEIIGDVDINQVTAINLNYYNAKPLVKTIKRDITTDSFYLVYEDTRIEMSRSRVQGITDTLKYLKGSGYVPETIRKEDAFETINYTCEINFLTGPTYKIIVGNKITDDDYFIKNPAKDYIYSIPKTMLERIFLSLQI